MDPLWQNFLDPLMNPDQPSDLGLYCLQYRLPKNLSRLEEQSRADDKSHAYGQQHLYEHVGIVDQIRLVAAKQFQI